MIGLNPKVVNMLAKQQFELTKKSPDGKLTPSMGLCLATGLSHSPPVMALINLTFEKERRL